MTPARLKRPGRPHLSSSRCAASNICFTNNAAGIHQGPGWRRIHVASMQLGHNRGHVSLSGQHLNLLQPGVFKRMPRIHFHQQLEALKDRLLAMAALSQQALEFSVEAYLKRDLNLCNHVLEIEQAINGAETTVDEMAYDLLAKEQPMA